MPGTVPYVQKSSCLDSHDELLTIIHCVPCCNYPGGKGTPYHRCGAKDCDRYDSDGESGYCPDCFEITFGDVATYNIEVIPTGQVIQAEDFELIENQWGSKSVDYTPYEPANAE